MELPLTIPPAAPRESKTAVAELAKVSVDYPALCPRYTARVIRGVKVGPSPRWLVDRLATVGIAAINNVVDITNYVLMECGQPLHAFDLAKLAGRQIVVRQARPGETFEAINHKTLHARPDDVRDRRRRTRRGPRRRDGRGRHRSHRRDHRPADRKRRVRSAVDPHHGPQAEPAQRFVVSLRARARSGGSRLGQPPLLPS